MTPPPDADDIARAVTRLRGRVLETPVVELPAGRERAGVRLLLKLENRQDGRAFKARGALNAALAARERGEITGLLTFSSGNHGQAVGIAARELGVSAIVVAPEDVRASKLAAMEARGVRVIRHGLTSGERMQRAGEIAAETGYLLIPPYDHRDVIAGQATVGVELLRQVPDLKVIVVPVGGGGLIGGISIATNAPEAMTVVGAEPEDADDARRSLERGELVTNDHPSTSAADGLRNTSLGNLNWRILRERVSRVLVASEEAIAEARTLIEAAGHGPVEPSGAVATAVALSGALSRDGQTVVAIVSGGNAD